MIKNSRNTVHSSSCGFFDTYSQRKTWKVPTRYRADTGEDSVKSTIKFLIFNNCSGGTHPVSSSIVHSSYRYCDDFGRDLPLSADPGEGFFIISILKQSSRYRRRQRVGTSRYCYDLYYVLPAIVFFAAERPWFNLGAYWVVKPLKFVFYDLKGRGPLKNSKKFAEM